MTAQRTFVSEDAFTFVTEIDRRDVPLFVAVHWTGVRFTPGDDFTQDLRKFLTTRPEVSEVWFVFPSDMVDVYEQLRSSDRFTFGGTGVPQEYRFFAMGNNGRLTEKFRPRASPVPTVMKSVESEVLAEGLRQIFRDTDSLAAAAAGFHFAHPSGKHSKYFIRASQAVSRVQHAYFVAWAMLRIFPACTDESTLWIDTAAVSSAAYAYVDLQRRTGEVSVRRVETFGGYAGVAAGLHPAVEDLVLISGSTSGSLSRHIIDTKKVPADRVATLFYLAAPTWPKRAGRLVCDMSDRDPEAFPAIRQSRIRPYEAHDADDCDICDRGSGTIALAGDSFFPAAGELDLRMPSFIDRPLGDLEGRERFARMTEFDGSTYFRDLLGSGVITFPATQSPHGVTTVFGDVLTARQPPHVTERIIAEAEAAVAEDEPVAAVISLVDPDSTALGQLLADHFLGTNTENNIGEIEALRREWRTAGAATLADVGNGTVLVVAAVVGSGRALTSISRELRKEAGDFHPEYFVAAAHPESSTAWTILTRTLERRSSDKTTNLAHIWRLPREPRFPGAPTPWAREADLLDQVGGWLAAHPTFSALAPALEPRLRELSRLDSSTLFVGALQDSSIEQLNADFALWPFDWTEHDSGAVPNHAEIYATVAHLLYESRRRNSRMDGRVLTSRRHGYALNPALFDRFNDPVIQAAVIRSAEPGELDYAADDDASHAVADVLWFVLDNIGTEAGGAAYEFMLALCEGRQKARGAGIRIARTWLLKLLEEVAKKHGADFAGLDEIAPHLQALLVYLRYS